MARAQALDREERGILAYFTRHRTAASFVMVLMLALGIFASTKIRSQFFPDVVIDTVTVVVGWDGAGPEEVDGAIIAPLEPALQTIEGVQSTTSVSKDGSATVTLVLEAGWDMGRATEDVKAAVESVRNLPDTADEPVVRRGVWKDKVTEVVVYGDISPAQLGQIGDDLVGRLFRAGVTRSTITGVAAPQIEVIVPEVSRVRTDTTLKDVANAIAAQANTKPAGEVSGGLARLRAGEELRNAEDIRNMVAHIAPDGSQLYIRNLARVTVTAADAERAYYLEGKPGVLIRVDRTSDGDALGIYETVKSVTEEMRPSLPAGVDIKLINARANYITDQLSILLKNGISGLILVLVVLFLFLNTRTAFWVAMGIPVSMLAAVGVIYVGGLTINMMTLFALIITLGIVVDDAIVVAEHADHRARVLGESPSVAPVRAVRRMLGPVFSSTATTVLAFIGLLFIGGSFGSLIGDIPYVVVAVLLASLVESFLILPNHMHHALAAGAKSHWYDRPSELFNRGFSWVNEHGFVPLMRWVIRLRYLVVALMILALTTSVSTIIRGDVVWLFYTAPESGSITGNFALLPGPDNRAETRAMTQELERAVNAVAQRYEAEIGLNPVLHALVQVGGTAAKGLPGQDTMDPDTLGSIDIGLVNADLRPFSAQEFVRELQQEISRPPGLATLSFRSQGAGPGGDSLSVNFYGADSFALKAAANDLIAELRQFPEVTGVEDSLPYGKEDVSLALTPQGEVLGFSTDAVGAELFARLNGITAVEFPAGVRSTAVTVRPPASELTADFLDRTLLRSGSGEYVPLGEIVTTTSKLAFSTVERENGRKIVTISGTIAEDDAARATEIGALLRSDILPAIAMRHNLEWDLGGLALQEDEFLTEAMMGFLLCILGIYLVLGWVFGSWARPFVVLAVIPFGLIGTVWGHASFGLAMSLFTIIGLIGMSGIIINDAIVLVSTIQDHARHQSIAAAAVAGARDRLRPILLTTLTTVLGLAPLMYESSRQALFLKPTVVTLVYGLSVGFFAVLLLVPALLMVQSDLLHGLSTLRKVLVGRRFNPRFRSAVAGIGVTVLAINTAILGPWVTSGTAVVPMALWGVEWLTFSPGAASLAWAVMLTLLIIALFAATTCILMQRSRQ